MPFSTAKRAITYSTDASAIFDTLAQPQDTLLLEAADIESKKNLQCLAILQGALKVTCRGQEVTAKALTPAGDALLEDLRSQFAEREIAADDRSVTFGFEFSTAVDERERLRDHSTADILRALQNTELYGSDSLPFLGGGFAFDYLATFEHLPEVEEGINDYPD